MLIRIFLFIIILISVTLDAGPLPDSIHGSISVKTGIINGTIVEQVYDHEKKVSHLNWNIDCLSFINTGMTLDYRNVIYIQVEYNHALNRRLGIMDDSDYQQSDGEKIKYSRHNNILENAQSYSCKLWFQYAFYSFMSAGLGINYTYSRICFTAADGYLKYPPTADPELVYGPVIQYSQQYKIPSLFIMTIFHLFQNLSLKTGVSYTPVTTCECIDFHVLREVQYNDSFKRITVLSPFSEIMYCMNDRIGFFLGFRYIYIPTKKGDTIIKDLSTGGKSETMNDCAGINIKLMSWNLGLSLSI